MLRALLLLSVCCAARPSRAAAQRIADLRRAGGPLSPAGTDRTAGTDHPPPPFASNADGFWRAAPPRAGEATALAQHADLCARTGADACVVVRGGRLVSEWYRRDSDGPLLAMSSTKSVTALLAMLLVADGRLRLDAPVCRAVSTWCDSARAGATVRHLLTMTAGLPNVPTDAALWAAADANAHAAGFRPSARPGTRWAYSNEGAQLLSPVLDQAAGEPVQRYAARRLFEPLGMRATYFRTDASGHAYTYANLETTPRDLARLGLLMLRRGQWGGRQLVPAALLDSLVRSSQPLNPSYGMLWWRLGDGTSKGAVGYATRGSNATNIYVLPAEDLVVVRMQRRPYPDGAHLAYETAALPLLRSLAQPRHGLP